VFDGDDGVSYRVYADPAVRGYDEPLRVWRLDRGIATNGPSGSCTRG
jgi:hypothetical protein